MGIVKNKQLLNNFSKIGIKDRLYLYARFYAFPYFGYLDAMICKSGKILDWGCGMGLFTLYMSLSYPLREITGTEIDERKVRIAKEALEGRSITIKSVKEIIHDTGYSTIVLLDVAYYLADCEYVDLLRSLRKRLDKNGNLIVKNLYKDKHWKYLYTKFQEFISTRLVKQTSSNGLHFRTIEKDLELMAEAGFEAVHCEKLRTRLPYLHVLYNLKMK